MILILLMTLLNPLFISNNIVIYSSLLSIVFIYNKNQYHLICLIIGIIFDAICNTYILNGLIYFFLSFIINYCFKVRKYNLKNVIVISMFIIFIYNTIYYLIFNLFINTFSYVSFITNLIFIYFINILYISLVFIFINKLKKHNIYW